MSQTVFLQCTAATLVTHCALQINLGKIVTGVVTAVVARVNLKRNKLKMLSDCIITSGMLNDSHSQLYKKKFF